MDLEKTVQIKCGREMFFKGEKNSQIINVRVYRGLTCDCHHKTEYGNCGLVKDRNLARWCYYNLKQQAL